MSKKQTGLGTCVGCGAAVREVDGVLYDKCPDCRGMDRIANAGKTLDEQAPMASNAGKKARKPRKGSNRALVAWDGRTTAMEILSQGASIKALRKQAEKDGAYAIVTILERFRVETKTVSERVAIKD